MTAKTSVARQDLYLHAATNVSRNTSYNKCYEEETGFLLTLITATVLNVIDVTDI